jgi:hypothetical protein
MELNNIDISNNAILNIIISDFEEAIKENESPRKTLVEYNSINDEEKSINDTVFVSLQDNILFKSKKEFPNSLSLKNSEYLVVFLNNGYMIKKQLSNLKENTQIQISQFFEIERDEEIIDTSLLSYLMNKEYLFISTKNNCKLLDIKVLSEIKNKRILLSKVEDNRLINVLSTNIDDYILTLSEKGTFLIRKTEVFPVLLRNSKGIKILENYNTKLNIVLEKSDLNKKIKFIYKNGIEKSFNIKDFPIENNNKTNGRLNNIDPDSIVDYEII